MNKLLLFFAFFISINLNAQNINEITGRVFDEKLASIGNAMVLLIKTQEVVYTDDLGNFTFDVKDFNLKSYSKYEFLVVRTGFEPFNEHLAPDEGGVIHHKIELKKPKESGFWVLVKDKKHKSFVQEAKIQIVGFDQVYTDEFGLSFFKTDENFNRYKPVLLTCKNDPIHKDYSQPIVLNDTGEIIIIELESNEIGYKMLEEQFQKEINGMLEFQTKEKDISYQVDNVLDKYNQIISFNDLNEYEREHRDKNFLSQKSLFYDFIKRSEEFGMLELLELKMEDHDDMVEAFEKQRDELYNSSYTAAEFPSNVDSLINAGLDRVYEKKYLANYNKSIVNDIQSDVNELLKIVQFELDFFKENENKMDEETQETYEKSIKLNLKKLLNVAKYYDLNTDIFNP